LIALKNGDIIPHFKPAYSQGGLNDFLSSYIKEVPNSNGTYQAVLGPRDVIYLFELYSTNPDSSYYDMQDIVVVVSFKDIEE
jgi:CO dehydrogenase/acetyl-CoA synthase gamma subunit (corrinoid Fe-S protein)